MKPWSLLQEYLDATPIDIPKRPKWNYNSPNSEQESKVIKNQIENQI